MNALEDYIEHMGENPGCDCCDNPATQEMNKDTCEWCASWFHGWYCDECFAKVKQAMIEAYYGLLP